MTRLAPRWLLALALAFTACSSPDVPRCAECGMRADADPRFAAGATRGQEALRFDAPKCLFRYLRGPRARGARDAWVTSYYDQARIPADRAVYVVGSDVRSPMGEDLVPLEDRAAAAEFVADHGGRAVDASAIDAALLESLL